jgi:hypothetical protein
MVKAFSKVSLFMPLHQTGLDFKRHSKSASKKMSLLHVFVVVTFDVIHIPTVSRQPALFVRPFKQFLMYILGMGLK